MRAEKEESSAWNVQSEWEKIDITNDYMFAYIMRKPDVCTDLLEYLLPGRHITKVEYYEVEGENAVQTQKALSGAFDKRGVRLDAYLDDAKRYIILKCKPPFNQKSPSVQGFIKPILISIN